MKLGKKFMTNIIVVLDNNVLVSALLFPQSPPGKIINLWQEKKFKIITSQPMVEEFVGVISRVKFRSNYKISTGTIRLLTQKLMGNRIKTRIPRTKVKIRDPKDIVILATALDGHADYLVTGDKDLLVLANHKSIRPLQIITPTEFLHLYMNSDDELLAYIEKREKE